MVITSHKTAVVCATFLFLTRLSAASPPMGPEVGDLLEGAISVYEVRDVGAEICRRHIFSPEAISVNMPSGYRLATLSDKASSPAVAELLRQRPELRDHARGSFCFIESGVHIVNGKPVHPGRRSKVVFLWADMVPTGPASSDVRYRGDTRRVQLFWLYDVEGVDRLLVRIATPNALFGRVTIERSGDVWRVGIETDDGALSGEVKPTSPRRRLEYPQPGYETVLLTDGARDHFNVVTFAGHHEQEAAGEWKASGKARWAQGSDRDTPNSGFFIQDGWAAKVGVYRYGQPLPQAFKKRD